ncbi:hypothetical protein CPT_Slocum_041 [Serratia phage Slocum]|nr:hypothetical protein CPT_Slocum_041 [Serratia phage Slocum]
MILNLVHETQRLRESDIAQEHAALSILDAAVIEIIEDKELDDTAKLGQLALAIATFSYVREHHHQKMKATFEEERNLTEVGLDLVTMH